MHDFSNKSELQIFFSYFKPHKKLFFLDIACALIISSIDLAFPAVSRWCLYTLLPQNAWRAFWSVMAVVTVAYILRSVCNYIVVYWGHRFGVLVENDIRRDLFRHIQKLSCDFFDKNRVGLICTQNPGHIFTSD